MSGNYPDVPGNRIAYDRDGTAVYRSDNTSSVSPYSSADITILNEENTTAVSGRIYRWMFFLFPRHIDLVGMCSSYYSSNDYQWHSADKVYTSSDTTNGADGTWTEQGGFEVVNAVPTSASGFRNDIIVPSNPVTNIIGMRLYISNTNFGKSWSLVHLYGTPSTTPTDNLVLYDPTTDVRVGGAYFDFGDIAQGSTAVKQFRVHNNSAQTANSVTISCETLTDTTPSVPGQFSFSTDGSTYASTATIDSIAPGATSDVVYVKRSTASNAALSLWWARIVAAAGSWT